MSLFKTSIPVDTQGVLNQLPAGHYLHGLQWNQESSSVEVLWEHDDVKSKFTFASEIPVANLGEAVRQADAAKAARAKVAADAAEAEAASQRLAETPEDKPKKGKKA